MKVDLYTKAMLTLIAACLLYLCFHKRIEPVQAQSLEGTRVVITGVEMPDHLLPVGIVATSEDCSTGTCVWRRDPIPVRNVSNKR